MEKRTLNVILLNVDPSHFCTGFDEEDLSEFCTINKKPYGRSLSKPQDVELIHLLTNDFVATGTRGGAKTKEDKIVDDALAGCPTTEKTTPFIDMDPGFRSVSRKIVNALAGRVENKFKLRARNYLLRILPCSPKN